MNELDELLERLGSTLDDGLAAAALHAADQARALLIDAIHDESHKSAGRSRRGRRWRPGSRRPGGHGRWSGLLAIGLSVAVTLVVIAVALDIGAHHTSSGAAVPNVLPFGNSLNPSGPTGVISSSVRFAAVVPDPEGSGPAWGLKTYRVEGDMTCFQVGREQSGRIGAVGAYGSFGDDGRFHPFTLSDVGFGTCVPNDAHHHAFDNVAYANAPASASGEPCQTFARGFPPHLPAQVRTHLTAQTHTAACEPRNERLVAFGLLGPDATSVTYRTAQGTATTRTHGPDGAYLIVEPVDPAICGTQCDYSGGGTGTAMRPPIGLIAAITYRDAPTCHGPPLTHNVTALRFDHCRDVGYVAPHEPNLTEADVASPVGVRVIAAKQYCFKTGPVPSYPSSAPATDLGPYLPCDGPVPAGEVRANPGPRGVVLAFSWIARQPVTSRNSQYNFFIAYPHNCGGEGGATNGTIQAGERLTRAVVLSTRCKGTLTGSIGYTQNLGPNGADSASARLGSPGSLLVGRFSFTLR
jgi:hypothetical protein